MREKLTGRQRHRSSLFGHMILQVEVRSYRERYDPCGMEAYTVTFWRDAKLQDFADLEQGRLDL